jgi:hypothetical protein
MAQSPTAPQFCPWCGTPIGYEAHEHEPRYETLAAEAKTEGRKPPPLPERIQKMLSGESYAGICPGCKRINHVVSHRADE